MGTTPHQHIQSFIDVEDHEDGTQQPKMPIVYPEELVGRTITLTDETGETTQIKNVEAITDHQESKADSPLTIQLKCPMNNDVYGKIMSYNQILEYLSRDDDDIL